MSEEFIPEQIAIIGMSGRFPKADSIDQFWQNLVNGTDCIDSFTIDEARDRGVPEMVFNQTNYVRRGGRLGNPELFDASFFGISPKDAKILDPQHRIFLQCGWEAIENAGYNVSNLNCSVGVFAGCGLNYYLLKNLIGNPDILSNVGELQVLLSSDKDFLATRLSYKFNLRGPSFSIQSACSTSLVALHVACQNLLTYQCDMALAGGVSLQLPWWNGYLLADADIRSPDGICRPFDASANGTIFGEGAGVVVLKRLQDAINDRDTIYAVIKGSAVNNDGSQKAGYTAPGIDGQTEAITLALSLAGVDATDISYVETHGTATPLGDSVEIAALTKAYRQFTQKKNFCGIGSVKAAIGHLDTAAGITSVIKTALALYHKMIPGTLHFKNANPLLDLDNSPFFVVSNTKEWNVLSGKKRCAGVSSLGVGGTNAHVIMEEAPFQQQTPTTKTWHLMPYSAKSLQSISLMSKVLSTHLTKVIECSLADCSYTLQSGRQHFPYRQFIVTDTTENAIRLLTDNKPETMPISPDESPKVVFLFSGQGTQYVNMGKDLYETDSTFKQNFDRCCDIFKTISSIDLRPLLFTEDTEGTSKLSQTEITQPLLFSFEYAMTMCLKEYGITPSALIGHSIGEYVAACIAGSFSLEDAIFIVTKRAQMMSQQRRGTMISIKLSEEELRKIIEPPLEIALINSPDSCVISGPDEAIQNFSNTLTERKILFKQLHTSHAYHSSMMNDILEPFRAILGKIPIKTPLIPCISNSSGDWANPELFTTPDYWTQHLRNTVKFSDGIKRLLADGYSIFLEVGPGSALTSFVKRTVNQKNSATTDLQSRSPLTIPTVRGQNEQIDDCRHLLQTLGTLWQYGVPLNWNAFYRNEDRNKVPLPTYQFDYKRHWVDPVQQHVFGFGIATSSKKDSRIQKDLSVEHEKNSTDINKNKIHITPLSPESPAKEYLGSLWKELLEIDTIRPSDNFFELGADSLLSTQLINRIKKETLEVIDQNELMFNTFEQICKKHIFTLSIHSQNNLPREQNDSVFSRFFSYIKRK